MIRYLGHYTHGIAISNQRIRSYADNKVMFSWKDYQDHHQAKIMTLAVVEFIKPVLLHILPHNFYCIRYYGLLANRGLISKLCRCRELLEVIVAMASRELT